jgi:hypothetical protein
MLSASFLMLPGCSTTVPLKMPWPTVPPSLMEPASDLKPLSADKKTLTDLIENANDNYSSYYTLKEKYNNWIEWYNMQKSIYENVK